MLCCPAAGWAGRGQEGGEAMTGNATFDYIVIGAGSAGCVLANRLTEDRDASVLLLEAGGWDRDPMIRIPLGWGKILEQRRHDWGYFTEPEPRLEDRRIETARGKVIGGSSSINAMAYVRGNRADYDRWRQMGLAGWSHDDVLPYFQRSEAWEGGADEHRGGGGPLRTRLSVYRDPLVEAYLEAARAAGYPVVADYNGASQDGFARIQQTIADGRRWSAAVAYLRPALRRPNLRVETGALTSRIVIEGGRAAGVEYLRDGRRSAARAEREVIVSGGTINSPQILMLSGIGDAAHLESVGIEPVVDRPQVGENLQDHLSAIVEYERPAPGPFRDRMRIDRLGVDMARAWLFGRGPATDLPGAFLAFLKTRPELEMPDVQFLFRLLPAATWPWCPGFRRSWRDGFACRPVLLRPESRGTVRLASKDPADPVRIRQNFLDSENDKRTLRDGFRIAREIASQPALDPFRGAETSPGAEIRSDDEIDAHIRATSATAHHPAGTCRMGIDRDAVVDAELKVVGVDRLRVVDASVMPDLVGGNINAPVIMIAERAADLIRGRQPLAPAGAGEAG